MQKPIKVLQVFATVNRGGAETNIMNYYRKIDKAKFHFDFAVNRPGEGDFHQELVEMGSTIYFFPRWNPIFNQKYKAAISDFFDKNNDYEIVHGNTSEIGFYFYKEASKRNIPVIIAHAHLFDNSINLKAIFRWIYKKRMLPYVNTYFTCGEKASTWLFGPERANLAFQMNNAIDVSDFVFNPQKSFAMKALLNAENSFNIVHIGRFNEQKNHHFLIDIFASLHKINSNSKLFLVGEGVLMESIKQKISKLQLTDYVFFLGLRTDVNDIMQAMDCFVFPSLTEGLPLALVEAQASGIKCVISDAVPSESILVPTNVEVISLKKSPDFWAEKINATKDSQKTNVEQLIIDSGFDINSCVKVLENKYTELLENLSKGK